MDDVSQGDPEVLPAFLCCEKQNPLGLLNISAPLEEHEGASFHSVEMCVTDHSVDTKAFCDSLFYSAFLTTES